MLVFGSVISESHEETANPWHGWLVFMGAVLPLNQRVLGIGTFQPSDVHPSGRKGAQQEWCPFQHAWKIQILKAFQLLLFPQTVAPCSKTVFLHTVVPGEIGARSNHPGITCRPALVSEISSSTSQKVVVTQSQHLG